MLVEIDEAKIVNFTVDSHGKCWLNVDGVCRVRIGVAHNVYTDDDLRGGELVWGDGTVGAVTAEEIVRSDG